MMRSQVKMPIMLFVLSLMAAFCSAKDNNLPETKVTALILMATTHIFLFQLIRLVYGQN